MRDQDIEQLKEMSQAERDAASFTVFIQKDSRNSEVVSSIVRELDSIGFFGFTIHGDLELINGYLKDASQEGFINSLDGVDLAMFDKEMKNVSSSDGKLKYSSDDLADIIRKSSEIIVDKCGIDVSTQDGRATMAIIIKTIGLMNREIAGSFDLNDKTFETRSFLMRTTPNEYSLEDYLGE